MSDSVRPQRRQPTRLPRPWDSPGKSTGVGCHFLLQCMKVKSESEVAQSCPTPSDPMDCSLPGSSAHGIFQARVLEWGAIAFSCIFHNPFKKSLFYIKLQLCKSRLYEITILPVFHLIHLQVIRFFSARKSICLFPNSRCYHDYYCPCSLLHLRKECIYIHLYLSIYLSQCFFPYPPPISLITLGLELSD